MEQRPFPLWLERFAAHRVVVAAAMGIVCAALGAVWRISSGHPLADPIAWGWVAGSALIITWLAYQLLGMMGRIQKLAESNADLARTNATLAGSGIRRDVTASGRLTATPTCGIVRATRNDGDRSGNGHGAQRATSRVKASPPPILNNTLERAGRK